MRIAIEDHLAIEDLMAAYGWALDTGDVEGLVACFTPNAVMRARTVRLWDGEVLKNFPGHGQWVPPKRPESLRKKP